MTDLERLARDLANTLRDIAASRSLTVAEARQVLAVLDRWETYRRG